MSAPPGNQNNIRHGLLASKLPKGCSYIRRTMVTFRASLEAEVLERHGEISTYRAALINSAITHETRALLLTRYLREATEPLSKTESLQAKAADGSRTSTISTQVGLGIMERVQLLAQLSNARDARDKCIERLGLSQDRHDNAMDAGFKRLYDSDNPEPKPTVQTATATA